MSYRNQASSSFSSFADHSHYCWDDGQRFGLAEATISFIGGTGKGAIDHINKEQNLTFFFVFDSGRQG
jgi:hypothetical protein